MGYAALLRRVVSMRCFRSAVASGDAKLEASEVQQFALSQLPEYWYLPLTALQATKINAALSHGADLDADKFLSPTQRTCAPNYMRSFPSVATSRSGN